MKKKKAVVELDHGAGARATHELIKRLFRPYWHSAHLAEAEDAALLSLPQAGQLVISTDLHVVSPPTFPGGSLGALAVFGTVNDLAVRGAQPLWLTIGILLEEGTEESAVEAFAHQVAEAAKRAEVEIVAADTKVVERGKGDGIYVATTGVGVLVLPEGVRWGAAAIRPGDLLLVSGALGDHALAIMLARNAFEAEAEICSDCAPLTELISAMRASGAQIRAMRDLTRGGLATTLHEWAASAQVGFRIDEEEIPVHAEVAALCDWLGYEPWSLANEGKLAVVCAATDAAKLLEVMRSHPLGREAAIIGEVTDDPDHLVVLRTSYGSERILEWPWSEPLPRIC